MGSMICCHLIRRYNFARFIKLSSSKQDKYHAIQEAIEQGGLRVSEWTTGVDSRHSTNTLFCLNQKIMLLIRLSPIPWPITNMLLSLLPTVTMQQYTTTAFLSSFKLCLEVWVGSQLADISNPDLPPSAHRIAVLTMLGSVVILVVVAWWLYRLTMQKVKTIAERKKHDPSPYQQSPVYREDLTVDDEEKSVSPIHTSLTMKTEWYKRL